MCTQPDQVASGNRKRLGSRRRRNQCQERPGGCIEFLFQGSSKKHGSQWPSRPLGFVRASLNTRTKKPESKSKLSSGPQRDDDDGNDNASTITTSATDALATVQTMASDFHNGIGDTLAMFHHLMNPFLEPSTLKDRTTRNTPLAFTVTGSGCVVVTGSEWRRKIQTNDRRNTTNKQSRNHTRATSSRGSPQRPAQRVQAIDRTQKYINQSLCH